VVRQTFQLARCGCTLRVTSQTSYTQSFKAMLSVLLTFIYIYCKKRLVKTTNTLVISDSKCLFLQSVYFSVYKFYFKHNLNYLMYNIVELDLKTSISLYSIFPILLSWNDNNSVSIHHSDNAAMRLFENKGPAMWLFFKRLTNNA
jgi:hypothetical protein